MPVNASLDTIGPLMAELRQGNKDAAGKLVEAFFPELRRMAAARIRRERRGHTWQPTVLVNELYLELVKIKALSPRPEDAAPERAAFFGLAGYLMKRLLIRHARPLSSRVQKVGLENFDIQGRPSEQDLKDVENLLDELASIDPKLRSVVEMRVFEGCTGDEIAARLGISRSTVNRHWSFASRWLADELA
jgi:RNA polymerase sigma factor (TIGR02999 family)